MNDEPASPSERERRFDEILATYFEEVRAGGSPTRQELLDRHPEFAAELEEFFADQDHFEKVARRLPIPAIEPDQSGSPAGSSSRGSAEDPTMAAERAAPSRPQPGTALRYIGDYELLDEIAQGGMGIVYKARQVSLHRTVAVKMILSQRLANDADVRRFRAEAEAAANLQHPYIVSIYEVGEHDGQQYFSMEYVEGHTLSELVRVAPLPAPKAARYVRQIAKAVQYAHEQGTLHRDLKPSNVLIDKHDNVRITDFGLAKRVEGQSELTATGELLGTPSYMPPEQAAGHRMRVGPRSDVYAMGAVLYESVTGRAPFRSETPMETLLQVMHAEPVSPRLMNPTVPRDVETICLKCLEKEPRRRYASAQELADELERFLRGEPLRARPVGTVERMWRWCRRNPAVATLSGAAVLLLVLVAVVATIGYLRTSQALDREALARHEAETAWQQEAEQRAEAERQRGLAVNLQRLAEERFYTSQMRLAWQAWEMGQGGKTVRVLEELRPRAGQQDLRGFGWHYLWRHCHADHLTFRGHSQWVNGVVFSPDGKLVASSDEVGSVKVWDAATGVERFTLHGHTDVAESVAFSPDGATLATGSYDKTAKLWDVATGRELGTMKGHRSAINHVSFSPDGKRLASAGHDHTIRIWDVANGQQEALLSGHTDKVYCVAFSPKDGLVASCGRDRTVRLWDLATRRERASLTGHTDAVMSVAFAPDGKVLASGGDDSTVRLWDVQKHQELAALREHTGWVQGLAFSPDGKVLASSGTDHTVRLWDAASHEVLGCLRGHHREVSDVAFSPDGETLATASRDATVKLWKLASALPSTVLKGHVDIVHAVALSTDGTTLVSAGRDGTVKLWDVASSQLKVSIEAHPGGAECADFSPDGSTLATGGKDSTVKLWNAKTFEQRATLTPTGGWVHCVRFSPDGSTLAFSQWDWTTLWDTDLGRARAVLAEGVPQDVAGESLAFSPDGRFVVTEGDNGSESADLARLWDAATGQEFGELDAKSEIGGVAFSPDGKTLAMATQGGDVQIWDLAERRIRQTLAGHTDAVWSVVFAPDGRLLASGSDDRTVKIWDIQSGQEQASLRGHLSRVNCLAFSPDGNFLASASDDHTIRVWNLKVDDVTMRNSRADQETNLGKEKEKEQVNVHPRTLHRRARIAHGRSDHAQAERLYRAAVKAYRRRQEDAHRDLALCLYDLGRVQRDQGKAAPAVGSLREAIAVGQQLAAQSPGDIGCWLEIGRASELLSRITQDSNPLSDAAHAYRRALELYRNRRLGSFSVTPFREFASTLTSHGRLAEAEDILQTALTFWEPLEPAISEAPRYNDTLMRAWSVLADTLLKRRKHAEAAKVARQLSRQVPYLRDVQLRVLGYLEQCVQLAEQDASLSNDERAAAAEAYREQIRMHPLKRAMRRPAVRFDVIQRKYREAMRLDPAAADQHRGDYFKALIELVSEDLTYAKALPQFLRNVRQIIFEAARSDNQNQANEFIEEALGALDEIPDGEATAQIASSKRSLESLARRVKAEQARAALIGQPGFPLQVDAWVNGSPISAEQLKGNVVLLDFWAVWCGPCIATFPHLRDWHDKYEQDGLVIVGLTKYYQYGWDFDRKRPERSEDISREQEREALAQFAQHHQLAHRIGIMPPGSTFSQQYHVTGIPQAVLMDRQGTIRMIRVGSGAQNTRDIERCLTELLAEPAGVATGE